MGVLDQFRFRSFLSANSGIEKEKCQFSLWNCGRKKQQTAKMNGEKNGRLVESE